MGDFSVQKKKLCLLQNKEQLPAFKNLPEVAFFRIENGFDDGVKEILREGIEDIWEKFTFDNLFITKCMGNILHTIDTIKSSPTLILKYLKKWVIKWLASCFCVTFPNQNF